MNALAATDLIYASPLASWAVVLVLVAAPLLAVVIVGAITKDLFASAFSGGIGFIVAVALMSIFVVSPAEARAAEELAVNRSAWAENAYGLSLSEEDFEGLGFPRELPMDDTAYGVATVVSGDEVLTVQLRWENGEFVLYGAEAQRLEPLEKVGD